MKRLFLSLILIFLTSQGMEKPQGAPSLPPSVSNFLIVVHTMQNELTPVRSKIAAMDAFLQRHETISDQQIDSITQLELPYKERKKHENFWFRMGVYFLLHARKQTHEYIPDSDGCHAGLKKILTAVDTYIGPDQLEHCTSSWRYILAHQPIVTSKKMMLGLLKKLRHLKDKGDGTRMSHLLVEEFAAEQDKVRLQWVAYLNASGKKDVVINLCRACATRWKDSTNNRHELKDIDCLVLELKATLANQEERKSLEDRAKKDYLK